MDHQENVKQLNRGSNNRTEDTEGDDFENDVANPESVDIWGETLQWFQSRDILPGNPDELIPRLRVQRPESNACKGFSLKNLDARMKSKRNSPAIGQENVCP